MMKVFQLQVNQNLSSSILCCLVCLACFVSNANVASGVNAKEWNNGNHYSNL